MNTIKFSHSYPKLWEQTQAKLLAVLPLSSKQFTELLLEYDTHHDTGRYHLPDGEYLQLVFIGNFRIPFCTIRPYTKEKATYYRSCIGEWFNIEVKK